jgi:predicted GIY-YIG superfamily endonuclease
LLELKAYIWCWIENILEKELRNFINPETGMTDENCRKLFNIYFGESNYKKLIKMQNITKLLKKKKILDKKSKLFALDFESEIKELNREAKQ